MATRWYWLWWCTNIQIWHPCGVANMVVYPEWALSPEGVARGWQCSRGVDYHVSNPAGMSHLFYYTETTPPTPLIPGHPKPMTSYKTHFGSVISEQHVYRGDHVGIYYMYLLYLTWKYSHPIGWEPCVKTASNLCVCRFSDSGRYSRSSARCQGDDVLAPAVNVPFHDSLYCWGRNAFKIPARGESISRPQQNAAVNNGIILLLGTTCASVSIMGEKVKSQPSWGGRLFRKDKLNTCSISLTWSAR